MPQILKLSKFKIGRVLHLANFARARRVHWRKQSRDALGRWGRGGASSAKLTRSGSMPTEEKLQSAQLRPSSLGTDTFAANEHSIFTAQIDSKEYFVKGVRSTKNAKAEVATVEAAKLFGLGDYVIPTARTRRPLMTRSGNPTSRSRNTVFSPLMKGNSLGSPASMNEDGFTEMVQNQMTRKEAARLMLFDYLTGNEDRHAGNLFMEYKGGKGQLKLIDNEWSFSRTDTTLNHNNEFLCKFTQGATPSRVPNSILQTQIPEDVIKGYTEKSDAFGDLITASGIAGEGRSSAIRRMAVLSDMLESGDRRMGRIIKPDFT